MDIRKYPTNAGNVGGTRAASAIRYIVIHYTGNDGDTAMNNAKYYAANVVKTSAHYFVDEKEIVQSVDDLRIAWAVGGNKYASCPQTGGGTLYGKCRNANSISSQEFAGWAAAKRRDGSETYFLRYSEFIPILWAKVREQEERLKRLEESA